MEENQLEYAGFWLRTAASIIDTILIMIITYPILVFIYGWAYLDSDKVIAGPADFLLTVVFPAIAVIWFWSARQATPGKMAISARIVDAKTGGKPSTGQLIGRYFGYLVSIFPFFLGILWVAFDRKKQGWHDKLAGTVVIRQRGPESVSFDQGFRG